MSFSCPMLMLIRRSSMAAPHLNLDTRLWIRIINSTSDTVATLKLNNLGNDGGIQRRDARRALLRTGRRLA
jgi:hypothetical protein